MKSISMMASGVVTIALICYSIGVITEQRNKILSRKALRFLTLGVSLDIIGTIMMIMGSSKGIISIHGLIGYSSLALMLTDTILMWRLKSVSGFNVLVSRKLHLYTRFAYFWWVAAYITGGLLVAIR